MSCSFDDKVIIEKAEFKKFTAGGDVFKVGIISDTQLPPNEKKLEENDLYVRHLRTALEELKNNGVDMILFAGDIGDTGSYFAFKIYKNTIDEVFGMINPSSRQSWAITTIGAKARFPRTLRKRIRLADMRRVLREVRIRFWNLMKSKHCQIYGNACFCYIFLIFSGLTPRKR